MRPRTLILAALLMVLVGLLGFTLVRHAVQAYGPEDEWIPARSIPNTDVNPYGANFFLAPGTGLLQTPNDTSLPSDVDEVSTEQTDLLNQFEIESTTLALTIDWDINDTWSFRSITAQRNTDHVQPFDFDGSEQRFIHTINDREFEDFSQEFQFNYVSDSVKAVMGYSYLDGSAAINSDDATVQ